MKTKYNVKLLNGSKQEVTYEGVETVTLPDADSDGVKQFTAGEPLDDFTVTPDFSEGDQTVEAPEGNVIRSGTITKPEGAEAVIAKGETLMGIEGEYVTPGTSKTVELDFSAAAEGEDSPAVQTITAEGDARWSEVVINKPENLTPENIAKDVEIAGVVGTMEGVAGIVAGTTTSIEAADAEKIRDHAFYRYTSLASVSFPRCTYVGASAFYGCTKLSKVTVSSTLAYVGAYAFDATKFFTAQLSSSGVAYLNNWVLKVGSTQTSVTLKPSATAVASYAFSSCSAYLKYIEGEGIESLSTSWFYSFSNLVSASFPACSFIGPYAFSSCQSLTEVYAPRTLSISTGAFSNCQHIASIEFPICKNVGYGAFNYAKSLSCANLPECADISGYAFYNCYSLSSAIFSNHINTVGISAFYGTPLLNSDIESTVYYLNNVALSVGTTVGDVVFRDGTTRLADRICSGKTTATFAMYGSEIEAIPPWAFSGCKSMTSISFPACRSIASGAFYLCQKISIASFPHCEYVGSSAFHFCSALSTVYLPVCSHIGSYAFQSCSNLKSVYLLSTKVPIQDNIAFYLSPIYSKTVWIYVRQSLISEFQTAAFWSNYAYIGLTDEQIEKLEGTT